MDGYNSCGLPLLSSEPLQKWKREAEQSAKREEEAREARRRRDDEAVAANWDSWWAEIDRRVEQHVTYTREVMGEATGQAIGELCADLREEFQSAIAEMQRSFEAKLAASEERLEAIRGQLPVIKTYCPDTVHYAGYVVVHQGATYQALRDTARAPPHADDWICIAKAGRDAITPIICGTYKSGEDYKYLDLVALNGDSFIARKDGPGDCPGTGPR